MKFNRVKKGKKGKVQYGNNCLYSPNHLETTTWDRFQLKIVTEQYLISCLGCK